ncbi:hypothetical protein BJP40_13070 [Streptomyces sp. CC53]|uniref:hypothetical protein n=1 Tax=unclassified Streptomyces TaxID=2593676 RepID=UPI0008DCCFC1|nr:MULTISPECIES: hypothetical protein [unclassified Streptomyces]OII59673.1 hypothetical protein BJP40_13070 [Streptomyces sp. CC53]
MYSTWTRSAAEHAAGFDWAPVWALGGVFLTGLFGLAVQRGQRKAAQEQTEGQAARDLSRWHRELRRTSYVDCIVTYEKFRDLVEPVGKALPWPVSAPLTAEKAAELDALLAVLDERYADVFQKCQIVRLEGPAALAHIAQGLILSAADFRHATKERAGAARAGTGNAEVSTWTSSTEDMRRTLEEFIERARGVVAVD